MSQRRIAQTEKLHRRTVKKILPQEEFKEAVWEGRSRLFSLIPKALACYERELDRKNKSKEQFSVARHVIDGAQVAIPRTEQMQGSFEQEISQRSEAELEYALKFRRWPSPEELDQYAATGHWPAEKKA